MANLCISPLHAGIISLSTANSSFILDLLRRSIRLCAVFLAIFLPAALVADGCFFLAPPAAGAAVVAGAPVLLEVGAVAVLALVDAAGAGATSSLGFICMIFRDRVGGGGSTNCSLG